MIVVGLSNSSSVGIVLFTQIGTTRESGGHHRSALAPGKRRLLHECSHTGTNRNRKYLAPFVERGNNGFILVNLHSWNTSPFWGFGPFTRTS